MVCPFCSYGVQQKLKRLDGIAELDVDLEHGLTTLRLDDESDLCNEILLQTVKDAGFDVAKITRNFECEFSRYEAGKSELRLD